MDSRDLKSDITEFFFKEAGIWNVDKLLLEVLQTRILKQVYSCDLVTKKMDYFPKEQEFASFMKVRGRYFESLELEDGYDTTKTSL